MSSGTRWSTRRPFTTSVVSLAIATVALLVPRLPARGAQELLGPNLVPNGSFEEGDAVPAGWNWGTANHCDATLALDASVVHSGKRSVRLHSSSAYAPNVYGGLSAQVTGLRAGSEYVIRLWAKGKGVGTCWFGGGPEWLTRRGFPTGDFDWQELQLRWTAPAGVSSFDLRLNVDSVTDTLWVDEVTFQEVNPISLVPRVTALSLGDAPRWGYLPLTPCSPPIDGDLSDWPADTPVVKLPETVGKALLNGGTGDLPAAPAVALRAGWNARALYLGITVHDPKHWCPVSEPMWVNDSIQVAFDPRHERTPSGYGPHDSEYSFALTNEGKSRVDCWQVPQGLGDRSSDLRLAVTRAGDLTTYEAAVPWSAIGASVEGNGPLFGLSLLVNDNNGEGRRGYVELTPEIGRTKDPSQFVTALGVGAHSLGLSLAKSLVYVGDSVPLTAAYFTREPVRADTRLEFTGGAGQAEANRLVAAPLPAGKQGLLVVEAMARPEQLTAGSCRIVGRVVEGDHPGQETVLASGSGVLQVSNAKVEIGERAAKLRTKLAAVTALAERCEARKIATDYERVALTTAADFIGFALDDVANDRVPRAEHVLTVLDSTLDATAARLRDYLAGRARPFLVPRYVTGPVEVRDGAFWADTVIPTTGQRAKRPVFFTGYGHFGRVVTDMDQFPRLGANIIQIEIGPWSTQPAENVVTDLPVRDYIGHALQIAEKQNVAVCWLTSPHYFPAWALEKWPELHGGPGGFIGYTVDAPQARHILETHIETALNAIKDSPALHSVCLSNEPTYTEWAGDPFRRPLWHDYLKRLHGTIAQLNEVYGTHYASFDEVPIVETGRLPLEASMTPLRYDEARFNMEQFAAYHRFMSDVVHRVRPGTPVHTKVMCVPAGRQNLTWGCDPEQFAYMGDLNGNDCWMMFRSFGDNYAADWLPQNLYYDIQRSMRTVPIFNTENHIIYDREQRLIPPEHTDCALWLGAIHGQGAETTWVWERTYDRTSDFEGSILHRPENVIAHGRAGLDLLRLAPEVVKLQSAPAPVAILYSLTAQLWSDRAYGAMVRAYEALNFTGLPVAFVSERQACRGDLSRFRAVILPAARHVPDDVYQALRAYAQGGGKLWVIGEETLARDEYKRPRSVNLPTEAVTTYPELGPARELRSALLSALPAAGVTRRVVLREPTGAEPWAVEYRAAPDGRGCLVSVVDLWGQPKRVQVLLDGHEAKRITDLRTGQTLPNSTVELAPLQARLLRVE